MKKFHGPAKLSPPKRHNRHAAFALIMKAARSILVAAIAPTMLVGSSQADVLGLWTFEPPVADIMNNSAGPVVGSTIGTGQATGFHASATTDWSTPVGNGSSDSLSSNEWAIGDYYQFTANTLTFGSVTLSWDQTRSGTGPAAFDLAWSIDGTNFTVFTDNYAVGTTSWSMATPSLTSSFTADLNSVAELNNAATVYFRLICDASAGNTGTSRVDNFAINGVSLSMPRELVWNPPSATWNTTNTNWLDGANPTAATPSDNLTFNDAGLAAGSIVTVDPTGVSAKNITVSNTTGTYTFTGGPIGGSGTLTKLGAGTLVLQTAYANSISVQAGALITQGANMLADAAGLSIGEGARVELDAGGETVGPVTLTGGELKSNGTVTANGDLTVNAAAQNSVIRGILAIGTAARRVTLSGGTTLDIEAGLAGPANGRLQFFGQGNVNLTSDNAATLGSNVQINEGVTLTISTGGSLGSAPLFFNGGTLRALAGATPMAITTPISLGTNTLAGPPTLDASRDFELAGAFTFFEQQAGAKTLVVNNNTTISGTISGTGDSSTLTVRGAGKLTIAGTNNSFKALGVDGIDLGSVEFNSTVDVIAPPLTDVVNGGRLTGMGTLGDLNVLNGTVAPGTVADPNATLGMGNFTFLADGDLELQIGGASTADYDRLNVTGTVFLAGELKLTLSGGFTPSSSDGFVLILNDSADAVTGTFDGLADGSKINLGGVELELDYNGGDGNDVTLGTIPEPGSAALLLAGLAILAARRRDPRVARA